MRTQEQSSRAPLKSLNDRLRQAKTAICQEATRISVGRYGNSLRAIVLTGSLSRNEATFIEEGVHWTLLGDADFFLVFQDEARLPSSSAIELATLEVKAALQKRGLIATVGLGPVYSSYFRNVSARISSFELKANGCTVWGDNDVLKLVPNFATNQLSLEDAWRLLANRIVEQMEAVALSDARSSDAQYRTIKLVLDTATSYLVFVGRYSPTYREREQTLRTMAEEQSAQADLPFSLQDLANKVTECTRFKLEGMCPLNSPLDLWKDAVQFAHLLWVWELRLLIGGETDHLPNSKLMPRLMSRQPFKIKIRGWASVLRACGWHRSWRQWPRWLRLCLRASPRYWVYSVAADILFRLPSLTQTDSSPVHCDIDWKLLADRLPLSDQALLEPGMSEWRAVAQLTALNYRRFLESTTA